jgi:PDZ domain-containing secreted protein
MHEGGDEVTITYTRDGKPGEAKVTLGTLEW